MKKFFSLVAVALLTLPMLAQDKVVTFDKDDFAGKGAASPGSEVVVAKEGVTFSCNKAYGTTYSIRCFAGSEVVISATENIKGVAFTFDPQGDKAYNGDLDAKYAVGSTEWKSGALSSQARFKTIEVTLGEGVIEDAEPLKYDTISPERAKEIGAALADNATDPTTYVVKGYVTYVKDYSTKYNNQDFYMASKASDDSKDNFYAFQTKIAAPGVKVGDLVIVKGKIMKYVGDYGATIEMKGGTCEIISATALSNTTVAEKAVKVLGEDGQVYIIRNGVKYNALGTVVE